ncbi:protein of unknown function [Candidatus Methylomirabilis oxygeniifera]|uniref:Uncharacterized protein n=1 Tax=Methylomirabilis oxygeniifera TaxID=671143 RepID=D5MKV3_METO1|nr:protein of unknown function [Candidatus Methylomirabilis oxyfera]
MSREGKSNFYTKNEGQVSSVFHSPVLS